MKRHTGLYFNMVEIVLAIAVAAVGITGIVGVLPVALKSNAKANGDSIAADAANTIFAEKIDPLFKNDWTEAISGAGLVKSSKPANKTRAEQKDFSTFSPDTTTVDGNAWKGGFIVDTSNKNGEYLVTLWKNNPDNDTYPAFSAFAYVWREDIGDVVVNDGSKFTVLDRTATNKNLVRVFVELTWPASADYKLREKRVFVKEYINPAIF